MGRPQKLERPLRLRHKYKANRLSVPYDWRSYFGHDVDPKEIASWKPEDIRPEFLRKRSYKGFADWKLDTIRRKFLSLEKDYQREHWMPCCLVMMSYIMKREMVPLDELSLWFGLPKTFLRRLANKDEGFRKWIIYQRWNWDSQQNKSWRAFDAVLGGSSSILEVIQPHWSVSKLTFSPQLTRKPVEVKWRPKSLSKKR